MAEQTHAGLSPLPDPPTHRLWVPAVHRDLTGGLEVIDVPGADVDAVLTAADSRYPGLYARLVTDGRLRPGLGVAVNGELTPRGLRQRLPTPSEIHLIRAAAGGHSYSSPRLTTGR